MTTPKDLSRKEMEKLVQKIELVDPESIILNPANPRTLTKKKFADMVQSVETFWQMLFLRPVILDEDGIALGGNTKTMAAIKAGFKLIPVIRAINLTPTQRREFIVKDNLHAGDWDFEQLANSWATSDLNDWGFSLPEFKTPDPDKEVKFKVKAKEPVYDIFLKADTEMQRQILISRLEKAGFERDKDFHFTD